MIRDEIKEILDYLKESAIKQNLYFETNPEKAKILLDYITNLQEENKILTNARYSLDRIELEDRINKAIAYITSYESINTIEECDIPENNEGLDEDTFIEMVRRYMIVHDKLLNILQGEDKDE